MKTRGGWREMPHEFALSRDPRDPSDEDLMTIDGVALPLRRQNVEVVMKDVV